ncbi:hypothetical protein YC2023_064445 [Brassica napus]
MKDEEPLRLNTFFLGWALYPISEVAPEPDPKMHIRNGLLKKAYELSVLCDAEIALLIFSNYWVI